MRVRGVFICHLLHRNVPGMGSNARLVQEDLQNRAEIIDLCRKRFFESYLHVFVILASFFVTLLK